MWFQKSPEKLLESQSPFDAVFGLVDRLRKKKDFSTYTSAERMLWCLNLLYTESENGSIEQYAANSSGDLFEETRCHLDLIKAVKARDALDNLDKLLNGKMRSSRNDRIEAISIARSLDETIFEKRTRELTDSLDWEEIFSAAVAYLREHKDELV